MAHKGSVVQSCEEYVHLLDRVRTMKAELKDVEQELSLLSDEIQEQVECGQTVELAGSGVFQIKDMERSSALTTAQRDECIRSFFADPSKFNSQDLPEVLAIRLIDSFQDSKTKVVSRKLVWKPQKK